jgi:hypothetical protein
MAKMRDSARNATSQIACVCSRSISSDSDRSAAAGSTVESTSATEPSTAASSVSVK